MPSPKYKLNQEDLFKILQALLFSAGSAIVATLIVLIGEIDFGSYAFLIPMINAVLYAAKKFFEGRS